MATPTAAPQPSSTPSLPGNFVLAAAPGCHIAHSHAEWILDVEPFDPSEYEEGARFPEIALDDEYALNVINATEQTQTYYITTTFPCFGSDGSELASGTARMQDGSEVACTTLVLYLPPQTQMVVCNIMVPEDWEGWEEGQLESDIQVHRPHASPEEWNPAHTYPFPLEAPEGHPGFLCSQGFCGCFTHYFAATHHAVDLQCPVGTPVLAVGDGEVLEVKEANNVSGIHVKNLFLWNSILVALDDGVFVEYVHIRAGSARVKAGDRVVAGQILCESGDVGFCPVPHLHIQMHASREESAPTIKFALQDKAGSSYFPVAGKSYNQAGLVNKKKKKKK